MFALQVSLTSLCSSLLTCLLLVQPCGVCLLCAVYSKAQFRKLFTQLSPAITPSYSSQLQAARFYRCSHALQSPNHHAMQDNTLVYDEPEERQQYRGKWQGTLTGDHSYARSSSSTSASSSSPSSSLPTHSRRPRSPGTYVALPNLNPQGNPSQASAPLRPPSPTADPSQFSDAAGTLQRCYEDHYLLRQSQCNNHQFGVRSIHCSHKTCRYSTQHS